MNTLEAAGEAMLQAQEGNRQIAWALWTSLRAATTRLIAVAARFPWTSPRPHG